MDCGIILPAVEEYHLLKGGFVEVLKVNKDLETAITCFMAGNEWKEKQKQQYETNQYLEKQLPSLNDKIVKLTELDPEDDGVFI